MASPAAPIVSSPRVIRVFVSSTFRDMQADRDQLVKVIFPQLRKLCEERAVTWTEVDLRWGITDEQKAEGKVLPLCLEEIHRCRPYFIGLLGERYGWVPEPNSIPAELLESQPWLLQHFQHSVTELEILHGVFREEPMHGHAYFYFRDPAYVNAISEHDRRDFTAESAEHAEKLQKLKQKIRAARDEQVCLLRENYATPDELGEWILEDFTALINTLYPKEEVPNELDQEAARHEAYAQSRRLAFFGREDLLRRLDEHASTDGKPFVLSGESGCGKSALLAEWVTLWRKDHSDEIIIQHYIGSTPDSADWQGLVRRILGELKRAFAISDDIPAEPKDLCVALNEWIMKAVSSRRIVLVLDGLNQLVDDYGPARHLGWLPVAFPSNFCVIVSSMPSESLDALRERVWPELNVPLFARPDIAPAALAYFKIFSKTPPKDIVAKLESTPAACNPLYLRTVLDELRQFGKHEELKAKAIDYLSAGDPKELYERILRRWVRDFGKNIVSRSLSLIWGAHLGLSEAALLELLGAGGQAQARAIWTPFYLAAENALTFRTGLLNFGHEYLRTAVRELWIADSETMRSLHRTLAIYFSSPNIAATQKQRYAEMPHHLYHAGEFGLLRALLLNDQVDLGYIDGEDGDEIRSWSFLNIERGERPPGAWFRIVAVDPGEIDWMCRRCHCEGTADRAHQALPTHCPGCGLCGDSVLFEIFKKVWDTRRNSTAPEEQFGWIRQILLSAIRPPWERAGIERELAERKGKIAETAELRRKAEEAVREAEELAERNRQEIQRRYEEAHQSRETLQGPPGGWFAVLKSIRHGGHDVYCRLCGSRDEDAGAPPSVCPNCGWEGSKEPPRKSARRAEEVERQKSVEESRTLVEQAYRHATTTGVEPSAPAGTWFAVYEQYRYGHSLFCRRCGGFEEDEGPPPEMCPHCGWAGT